MSRLFGTDGIRGVALTEISVDLAARVAAKAAVVFRPTGSRPPLAVIGRDTRPSGPALSAAAIDGMARRAGAEVIDLGIIPTPAVAHAVAGGLPGLDRRPDFGVVISASHNPVADNGIKFFGPGGSKLSVEAEDLIADPAMPSGDRSPGDVSERTDHRWYVDHLLGCVPAGLDGLRVVVDCANGAASTVAPEVYRSAGADVVALNTELDGRHINDGCGATHLEQLQAAVIAHGADLGIAHDGDADRCLAVDASAAVVDGDAILAVLALGLKDAATLAGDAIAVTVMSNQGLVVALADHGVEVRRTDVGDRAVLERMLADGLTLGGEQSGHILQLDHATTGDGLLTALALMARVVGSGRTLADLAAVVRSMPQVLMNVAVSDKAAALAAAAGTTAEVEAELGATGRVLVRPSGTEPLLRVMVEATTEDAARAAAERIAAAIG
jgi:phosphoglucosamine mutase